MLVYAVVVTAVCLTVPVFQPAASVNTPVLTCSSFVPEALYLHIMIINILRLCGARVCVTAEKINDLLIQCR